MSAKSVSAAPSSPASVVSPTTAPEDRVPLRQKLAYGLGQFMDMWGHWLYPTIAFQLFGLVLHVSGTLIGIAIILNRVFDAISDPFFGWWSDNTRTRFGRRRPFMLVGCILAGIGLPFLLAVPFGWSPTGYFVFMLISSAIYLPMVSCFNMPWRSLGNELTPDYHERTSVFSYQNAVKKLPELGLFYFGNFFSMAIWVGADRSNVFSRLKQLLTSTAGWHPAPTGTEPNTLLGAQVYLTICGVIMIVAGLVCVATMRERYYNKLITGKQEKVPIIETLRQTLQCRPFRIQIALQLAYNLGLSMVGTLGLANTFYYVCNGDKALGNWWNSIMGVAGMVLGFLGIPVFAFIARQLGKRHAMAIVLLTTVVVFIGTWWLYTPKLVWLQLFATGFIAFTGAGFWLLDGSMRADILDYDERNTGKRREGAFESCISWIGKVGMAVGAGVSFFILDWVGFDSSAAHQSDHTIFMIRFLFAAIPIVGLFVALLALSRFPLTQETMAVIRGELEERRGRV
jgi:GPH family glycoside/pentoside/hexuronide:cation symporter